AGTDRAREVEAPRPSAGPLGAVPSATLVPLSGVPVPGAPVPDPTDRPVSGAPVSGAGMPGLVSGGQPAAGPGRIRDSNQPAVPDRPLRRIRSLRRLRIGAHGVSPAAVRQIEVPGVVSGLVLGRDSNKAPVMVRMFRDEPTRLSLIGGLWAARLLVFRALATGARVVVFTPRPTEWQGFGRWATGRDDRVAVMPGERPVTVGATATSPALLLYDVGPHGATQPPALGPWQTQLTVLRQFTSYGFASVQASNMVLLQRLATSEAHVAASVLRLDPESEALLQVLRDDMLAVLGGQADRYLWLNPTEIESQQFGAPQR
ncbi:MAG: hypothetical protein WCA46_11080, partial [Actinocatenispora sp.]